MTFKVQVGPAQIAIHQGQTVLVTEPDGQVIWPSERGLYFRDTRVISAWAIYADGEPWDLLNGGAVAYHAARIFQTNRAFVSEDGPIAARTLGLVIGRHIDGGLHEDIEITNSRNPVRFNLEIAIRADFADIFEVKSNRIVRRGRITTSWSAKRQVMRITYRNKDFRREVIIRAGDGDGGPTVSANGRLSFDIALKAGQAWHRCLTYDLMDGEERMRAPRQCTHSSATLDDAEETYEWQRTVLKIRTSNEEFYRCYNQGVQDMAALRLPLKGMDHMVFVPAAGLPWFVALFGRDTLIVSLQAMIVYPEFAGGALEVLGQLQANARAPNDGALFTEVLCAANAGKQAEVLQYVEELSKREHPGDRARAVTLAGFCDSNPITPQIFKRVDMSKGFLGQVRDFARASYEQTQWARHWYQKACAAGDPVEFWCACALMIRASDGRFALWFNPAKDLVRTDMQRFARFACDGLADRATDKLKDRGKTLFGLKPPTEETLQAIEACKLAS